MIDAIFEALKTHEQLFWLLGLGSIALLIGTALLIPWLLILLPRDFFARMPEKFFTGRHPVVAFLLVIFRNVVGALLLVSGIIMLFIPGQGLLTILVGLALIDFPGRHTLLMRLFSNPRVFNAANGVRRWAGKPDFLPANKEHAGGDPSRPAAKPPEESLPND